MKITNWAEIKDQRDADGNLTDLALAVDALEDSGCDCGTDEPGTCLACRCEAALKGLWEQQTGRAGRPGAGEVAMEIKIDGRNLVVDVRELLEHIDTEHKLSLADSLACMDDVIKYVTQQILDGWTEQDSRAGKLCNAAANPSPECCALDWACREVAKRAGEVAADEIRRLEESLAHARKDAEELRKRLFRATEHDRG